MAMTKRGMSQLVRRVGRAIDAAKKGKRPSSATAQDAEMGVYEACIEVCAFEYANDNPCGCNDHEHGYEPVPTDDDDDGETLVFVPLDEPTLLDEPPTVDRPPRPGLKVVQRDPGETTPFRKISRLFQTKKAQLIF